MGTSSPPPKRCTGHSFAQLLLLYSPLFVCERFCHSLHVVTGEHRYGSACSIHATKRRVVWPTCMCWRHPRTVVHALRCLGHSWCSGIQPSNAALLCMVLEPTVCCTSIAEICVALIQASAQGAFLGALKWCWRHLCRVSSFDVVVTSFSEFSVDYKCPDWTQLNSESSNGLCSRSPKPAIKRVQTLADISHSALHAFAVYEAISLHTCVLS